MSRDEGPGFIEWEPRDEHTKLLVKRILIVINGYKEADLPTPTIRDVYYDLRGKYGYAKSLAQYRRTTRLIRLMRRSRNIPLSFDDVDDDTATAEYGGGGSDESPAAWLKNLPGRASVYDRDWSEGQPLRVIVLTEGAGKVRQFSTVAYDYGVEVRSGGGWESVDYKHALARDAYNEYHYGHRRPTVYLHCGDFDADGVALYESGVEDVMAFVDGLSPVPGNAAHWIVSFERVMLTEDQILEHVPDQNLDFIDRTMIKPKDHRGLRWYEDQDARGLRPFKCELEALSLETRLEIVREAIEDHVDLDQLKRVKDQAERERTMLGEVIAAHVEDMVEDARERSEATEPDADVDHDLADASEATEPQPEPEPEDEPDEGRIPAFAVDHVQQELERVIFDTMLGVASGRHIDFAGYSREFRERIARRWLRGE